MKILSIAAAVALSTVSLSALAKDKDQVGVADNAFTYSIAATGTQSVIGAAIEGNYSSQMAVAVGTREITGTGGVSEITGTGGVSEITGTGGVSEITGTGGVSEITGTGGVSKIIGIGGVR